MPRAWSPRAIVRWIVAGIALTANPAHALNHYNTGKGHIVASAEASLAKLGTDHLDLLLIHRP